MNHSSEQQLTLDDQTMAESFGPAADLYHATRRGYSPSVVRYALPEPGCRVLDLAAGTGKLTGAVAARAGSVVAVEPAEQMLAVLRAELPGVQAVLGRAEQIDLPDESVDAVVVGAAFHWFDRPAADAEIARVLKPGGPITLMWNGIDTADPAFGVFGDTRSALGLPTEEVDETIALDPRWFGRTELRGFDEPEMTTVDAVVAQLSSRSYVMLMPRQQRAEVLAAARSRLLAYAGGQRLRVHYRTITLQAHKLR